MSKDVPRSVYRKDKILLVAFFRNDIINFLQNVEIFLFDK